MRLKISLILHSKNDIIPINYQYPFSAVLYTIMARGDSEYAHFLHETGYKKADYSNKVFKLFTFSDIRFKPPFKIKGDRIVMQTNEASVVVCFHMAEAASHFVKGLFLNQQIDIADKRSKVSFTMQQVEVLPLWDSTVEPDEIKEVVLEPLSPMVIGVTNSKGNYDFLYPDSPEFIPALLHHWKEKYRVLYGEEETQKDFEHFTVQVLNADIAKPRLIKLKAYTPQQTEIRGFVNFQLKVEAKVKVLELALSSGIGVYNSQGFGCVEVKR